MNYRYPGPQSFTEGDELLFFGRQRETKALYDLIMVQPIVVLFAKSGMGKTSLLQAGILPRLRFTNYSPFIIRLNDTATPLEQQTLRKIAPDSAPDTILWSAILRHNTIRHSTPLLIFDQFEEVFTLYSDAQRTTFIRQLADVINGTIPDLVRKQIQKSEANELSDKGSSMQLEQIPRVRIVLSIRSDLLHFLHLLSLEIPSILRNRFELTGLRSTAASEAIIQPAAQAQTSGNFSAPAFQFSTEALNQILSYLSHRQPSILVADKQEPEIESFQLQLLCRDIEEKIIASHSSNTSSLVPIEPDFYGGQAGIEAILSQFYDNTLHAISDLNQRKKARRLLEDHLMKEERRVGVDKTTIIQTYGVEAGTLDLLVQKRLLRQDARETGVYFEISHDTLLTPIVRSKKAWEKRRQEQRTRQLWGFSIVMIFVATGLLALVFWALKQRAAAEASEKETQKAKQQLEITLENFLKEKKEKDALKAQEYLQNAETNIQAGFIKAAREDLNQAMQLDSSQTMRQAVELLLKKIQ